MGEGSITYEELFELLRRERNSEELQTLDGNFYADLIDYFQDKQSVIKDTSEEAQMFGSSEKEKVSVQLENAQKIAKELIERREKKIIILALNKARTASDIIDTSALLDVEKEFFHQCAALFTSYKKGVLENVANMKNPVFGDAVAERTETEVKAEPEPADEAGDMETETTPETSETKTEEQETMTEQEETAENTQVRFKASIPKFMGKDKKVLGPFEEDETAELSSEIAQILIKKGKAEELQ